MIRRNYLGRPSLRLLPVLYFIFGLYFINLGINYFDLSGFLSILNNWLLLIGGILFLIACYNSLVNSPERIIRRMYRR